MKDIKDYLNFSSSVCREERQFALFLYNIFLKKLNSSSTLNEFDNKVIKICLDLSEDKDLDEIKIEHVFYEATLMRDYYFSEKSKSEKSNFNEELLKFSFFINEKNEKNVIDNLLKNDKLKKSNLGTISQIPEELSCDLDKIAFSTAKMMMNVTPDILVIYSKKNDDESSEKIKWYAQGIECKYKSNEGTYTDIYGSKRKMQYFIQECVMSFLFGKGCIEKMEKYKPQKPQKGYWENRNDDWKESYGKYYNNMVEYMSKKEPEGYITSGGMAIKNKGIKIVRFDKDIKKEQSVILKNITGNSKEENKGYNEICISLYGLLGEYRQDV